MARSVLSRLLTEDFDGRIPGILGTSEPSRKEVAVSQTYNHAYLLAFEVTGSESGTGASARDLLLTLERKVEALRRDLIQNPDAPAVLRECERFDTFEED